MDRLTCRPVFWAPERITRILDAALSLLLPSRCAACGELVSEEAVFCELCSHSVDEVLDPCPRCSLPLTGGPCLGCQVSPPPFARAVAPLLYGGQLAEAVRRLKYTGRAHLARPLARLMRPSLLALPASGLMVPVPLHPRSLRRRGYNQAALLLAELAPRGSRAVDWGALQRFKQGPAQAGLGRQGRLSNLRGAFSARPDRVQGRCVILVDDVMTTGATATACSEALVRAGATEVHVLTLARAVP